MTDGKNDYIDLLEWVRYFWHGGYTILKGVGIALLFGLVIAFGTPNQYEVVVTVLPERQNNQAGGGIFRQLGGLAGAAGIDLSGFTSEDAIRPDVYPRIFSSLPFLLYISEQPLSVTVSNDQLTLKEYFSDHYDPGLVSYLTQYTIGLPGLILSSFKNEEPESEPVVVEEGPISVSLEYEKMLEGISDRISANYDTKTGIISVIVEMPEPRMAAEVAQLSLDYLLNYVRNYRLEKVQQNLSFTEGLVKESKVRFEQAQMDLAKFRDSNLNIMTASARTKEERLLAEYSLSSNLYSMLSQQLEQMKIKVQEETPVFSILNPVKIPNRKSKPKKALILMLSCVVGGLFSASYLLIKKHIAE